MKFLAVLFCLLCCSSVFAQNTDLTLMRGKLEVNTGVTFFALLGGVAAFGPVGLLAGPLIVAFFLAVVRMCQKELTDAPPSPAPPV